MVNATEMIKAFPEKRMNNFTRTDETEAFVKLLESKTGKGVLTVNHGGSTPGTWMHQKLALKFAAWLSPEFELWVYDRIEDIAEYGFTATPDKLEEMIANPDLVISLANELKRERSEKQRLSIQNELQQKQLTIAAPKVQYHDEVLQAINTHTSTTIAKELGMSAQALNRELKRKSVIYFHDGHWVLYSKYQGLGYTKTKTTTYENSEGKTMTNIITVWTEMGREFIHHKMKSSFIPAQ